MFKKIGVLAEGAWGSAVSDLIAKNGHEVLLWCYNKECATEINQQRTNSKYMPDLKFIDKITATTSIQEVFQNCDLIFEAVPVQFLRSVFESAKPYYQNQKIICLSKGIEEETLMFPSQIVQSVFGIDVELAVIVGPSFAKEVVSCDFTAVNCATQKKELFIELSRILNNDYFKIYYTQDLIGIECSAAIKNVIALAVGVVEGAGCGDDTKAIIITAGLAEIATLVAAIGGKKDTAYGLSGLGDLILTTTGKFSKNLAVGKRLGSGEKLSDILKTVQFTPEGPNSLKSVKDLSIKYGLNLPFCNVLNDFIEQKLTPKEFVSKVFLFQF